MAGIISNVAEFYSTYSEYAKNISDRRGCEIELENMMDVLENRPSKDADAKEHKEYRRKVNDALVWAEMNLPLEEYQSYDETFKKYLKETVPEDNGRWSNGTYTHHYSQGSLDEMWQESALRGAIKALAATAFVCDKDEKARITAHNRRTLESVHEAFFRIKHNMNDTPPLSPRSESPNSEKSMQVALDISQSFEKYPSPCVIL